MGSTTSKEPDAWTETANNGDASTQTTKELSSKSPDQQAEGKNAASKKPTKKQKTNNNNNNHNKNSKKESGKEDGEAALDNDMHFIVDTFDSVEKMKERHKRRRWRRNKEKEEQKSNSAPSRLPAEKEEDKSSTSSEPNANVGGGLLARGRQFLFRGRPTLKPQSTPILPVKPAETESQICEDEWEYKEVVIDGFDPEKFKRVNNKKSTGGGVSYEANELSSIPHLNDPLVLRIRKAEKQQLVVPPAYDVTEEQLMTSIEQEFST